VWSPPARSTKVCFGPPICVRLADRFRPSPSSNRMSSLNVSGFEGGLGGIHPSPPTSCSRPMTASEIPPNSGRAARMREWTHFVRPVLWRYARHQERGPGHRLADEGRQLPKHLPTLSVRYAEIPVREQTGGFRPNFAPMCDIQAVNAYLLKRTSGLTSSPAGMGGFLPVRFWREEPRRRTFARAIAIDSFAPMAVIQGP
jgi:hypothetical protein